VLNHPAIGLQHFDEFSSLQIEHPSLLQLHRALLNVFATAGEAGDQPSPEEVRRMIEAQGLSEQLNALDAQIRYNRIWQAMSEAAFEDARDGWLQAHSLHMRSRALNAELKAAERAFNELGDENSFQRLNAVLLEKQKEEGTEALIEGFGVSSGRPMSGF
jgi:DNA primase